MGSLEKKYLYPYDDNYKILAHYIVGAYRAADVLRCLSDNAFLKTLIIKETRQQDLGGPFTDCIIQHILEDKERMEWMHILDGVALYLYSKLDKERLRNEIQAVLNDAGIVF